jgi:mRNA-decapping enzyme 1B
MQPDVDAVRRRLRVTNLQMQDPAICDVLGQAQYVGLYTMKEGRSGNPEWEKASIEGAMFIVRRSTEPKYNVIIKNQLGADDLIEVPTADWDLDIHPNYLLYRTGDGDIKGWWFHDDEERKHILQEISVVLDDLKGRNAPKAAPAQNDVKASPQMGSEEVMMSKAKLRSVLVEMVTSDKFLDDLLARLKAGAAADKAGA